jgi:DNA ligase-1
LSPSQGIFGRDGWNFADHHWVKRNTVQRFGPFDRPRRARFEIAFEGIQTSPRHKSGIALRFPRIFVGDKTNRWMKSTPLMI